MRNSLDFWLERTLEEKKDIFTTSTGVYMNKYGFVDVTKKEMIGAISFSIFKIRRVDLLNEIYYDILNFEEKNNFNDIFEKIILTTIDMDGCPIDNYWLYMTLDNFYSIQKKDIDKRIEICKKSFHEIDLYLPQLISFQNSIRENNDYNIVGTLPNFVFCRDRLIYVLVDGNKFEEAEFYEKEMIKMNLFPNKNGMERLMFNKAYLLSRYIYHLLWENNIDMAKTKAEEYKKIDPIKAGFSFMEIADYLFFKKKYEDAHNYYCLVSNLNPMICGIEKRIKETSKILNVNYNTNKSAVIEFLKKHEEELTDSYELLSLANRYLDIEEYDTAINLNEQLIKIRGNENSLLLNLSKIYKTIAQEKMKAKEFDIAVKYYNSSLNTLNRTTDITKTIEKQIELLKDKILKITLLQDKK